MYPNGAFLKIVISPALKFNTHSPILILSNTDVLSFCSNITWLVTSILQTVVCFPYLEGVMELGVTELVISSLEK
jgi:hypothetical protein